jgi:hypothetical protein
MERRWKSMFGKAKYLTFVDLSRPVVIEINQSVLGRGYGPLAARFR